MIQMPATMVGRRLWGWCTSLSHTLGAFGGRSLQTRITVFTLGIFLLGMVSLATYSSHALQKDMLQVLSEQQFSVATLVAADVDRNVVHHQNALENVAADVTPELLDNPAALKDALRQRHVVLSMFNGGVIAYRSDGLAIAEIPFAVGRVGTNYADRDYLIGALQNGKPTIGRPHWSRTRKFAEFVMSVPIRRADGLVIGALAGITNLTEPNFLDHYIGNRYGASGGYVLLAPQHHLMVTATDKRRILEALPALGLDPVNDQLWRGDEITVVLTAPQGQHVLASAKRVPVAGWVVAVVSPVEEALAPIRAMQARMMLATLMLTLLAGVLIWWLLRREMAPLLSTVQTLAGVTDLNQTLAPLPIWHQDEIGRLIGSFNRLLAHLAERSDALRDSENRFRTLIEWSPEATLVYREGRILYANPSAAMLFDPDPLHNMVGMFLLDLVAPESQNLVRLHLAQLSNQTGGLPQVSLKFFKFDGSIIDVDVQTTPVVYDGQQANYSLIRDITARKQIESELRIAAAAFESQQGTTVTDANRVILRVNQAFSRITGYSACEVVGKNPSLLASGRHDPSFYRTMWQRIDADGAWQGEIWNRRKNGEIYPEWLSISAVKDAANATTHYVATFFDISSRKNAEDHVRNLAFFDPLTQLPNRRLLQNRLAQAIVACSRHKRFGALLYIDLDHFKTINEVVGHLQGDLLLKSVAKRLQGCVRGDDTVAHLGGDKFVVLLEDLGTSAWQAVTQAENVADKIRTALHQDFPIASLQYHSSASIGITLFGDRQELSFEETLRRSELAMYQAKAQGRNTYCFFDPQMQRDVLARAAQEEDLRQAMQQQQFVLYYQAQVVGSAGRLIGAEVLVRWMHPQRGLVSPADFIPLAEDTGQILPLGQWVLETACQQLAQWASEPALAHLTLAVNVSAKQLQQTDFVARVQSVLERTGADPCRLKLELTESLLVKDVTTIIAKMTALKALGVGFSLDDFGTGYSSLSYLKRLPLDQLKIDQSFVKHILTDANDAAIAKMVIALAESLGLTVIAEGVEMEPQRDFLAHLGCHVYQGYFFGRPTPVADFEAYALAQPGDE